MKNNKVNLIYFIIVFITILKVCISYILFCIIIKKDLIKKEKILFAPINLLNVRTKFKYQLLKCEHTFMYCGLS